MILKRDTALFEDLHLLVQYIIDKTDAHILLIPHVLWKGQDDRVLSDMLYEEYKSTGKFTFSIVRVIIIVRFVMLYQNVECSLEQGLIL